MPVRDRFLRGVVLFGVALLLITEALSAFHALTRIPLLIAWLLFLAALLPRCRFAIPRPSFRFDPVVALCAMGIATILTLTAITAAFSPPNSSDAMAYHMPRVIYWAEQHSVRFFPTPYLNQIMLQPLAEYLMLHTYILSGGDRFINFVQWFASVGSVIGVSAIAKEFGAKTRGQWIAALFCATLPSGILASSGAKNDYFLAMWLTTAVYFAFRLAKSANWMDALFLGAAAGLALNTKATAYLFLPLAILAVLRPFRWRPLSAAAALALCLNAPQYARNFQLSGSIMGFNSAQGDGVYRWQNGYSGWKATVSNFLRNTGEQLGARSEKWNTRVFDFVNRAHQALGINPNDPATTWPYAQYTPPKNSNHEADAPNRFALFFLIVIAGVAAFRSRPQALYALALFGGFVAFCFYLRWQPFMARLFLPLFVLGSPLAAALEEWLRPPVLQIAACLLLLDSSRLPTLENWVRPLRGPRNIFQVDRDTQYFADLTHLANVPRYQKTIREAEATHCDLIAVDISIFQPEYPLLALIGEHNPKARFVHTNVHNPSARYAPSVTGKPCATVCLECRDTGNVTVP
ncbi:MAG TPA: glycosyltransferase family 39 protein [Bryobacteraceae bacterium]